MLGRKMSYVQLGYQLAFNVLEISLDEEKEVVKLKLKLYII